MLLGMTYMVLIIPHITLSIMSNAKRVVREIYACTFMSLLMPKKWSVSVIGFYLTFTLTPTFCDFQGNFKNNQSAKPTGDTEDLKCDLVI